MISSMFGIHFNFSHNFINDLEEGINTYLDMFPDDAKLLRLLKNREECEILKKF